MQIGFIVLDSINLKARKNCWQLSEREKDILRLIVNGLENKAIARMLFISVKTVETHKENLKVKLGLKSIRELYDLADYI